MCPRNMAVISVQKFAHFLVQAEDNSVKFFVGKTGQLSCNHSICKRKFCEVTFLQLGKDYVLQIILYTQYK